MRAKRTIAAVAAALALLTTTSARAEALAAETTTDTADAVAPATAPASARVGSFLPWSVAARSDTQRGLVTTHGGYDSGRRGALFQSVIEAQVLGPLSIRAGASLFGKNDSFRPDAAVRIDALRQDRHGIDLAMLTGYEAQGFNLTSAVFARLSVSRAFRESRLLVNAAYGQGTEEGERYGDVRLAFVQGLTRELVVGLDSRFRIDLERDDDEPAGEPDWDALAGPLLTYSFDRVALSASGGFTTLKYRLLGEIHLGAMASLGLGAAF